VDRSEGNRESFLEKFAITVKPGTSRSEVLRQDDGSLIVYTRKRAVAGEANEDVIRLLAEYLSVPKSHIRIVRGGRGRRKLVEIA
jgi:uncharacterized protein YggU (UPF0235/DUF167 family)